MTSDAATAIASPAGLDDSLKRDGGIKRTSFRVGGIVGRGATAIVRQVLPESIGLAAKSFIRGTASPTDIRREIVIHQSLPLHPNILAFHSAFYTEAAEQERDSGPAPARQWHIVMEMARGGELFEQIEPDIGFPPTQAVYYLRQLVAALLAMHGRAIAHRDIKPENLLLSDTTGNATLKVADFGLATCYASASRSGNLADGLAGRVVEDGSRGRRLLRSRAGTRLYAAPEILAGEEYEGEPVDVWSAGIVLFLMLSGDAPWSEASEQVSLDYAKYRLKGPVAFFAELADFVDLLGGMLCPDPGKRWSLKRVAGWLAEPLARPLAVSLSNPELAVGGNLAISSACGSSTSGANHHFSFSQPSAIESTSGRGAVLEGTRLRLTMSLEECRAGLEEILADRLIQFKSSADRIQFGTVDRRNCPLLGTIALCRSPGTVPEETLLVFAKKRGDWLEFKRLLSVLTGCFT